MATDASSVLWETATVISQSSGITALPLSLPLGLQEANGENFFHSHGKEAILNSSCCCAQHGGIGRRAHNAQRKVVHIVSVISLLCVCGSYLDRWRTGGGTASVPASVKFWWKVVKRWKENELDSQSCGCKMNGLKGYVEKDYQLCIGKYRDFGGGAQEGQGFRRGGNLSRV